MSRLPIDLELDADGRPRASWSLSGPADMVLPDFLEVDLAGHSAYVSRLIDEARRAVLGRSPGWSVAGNAYALQIGREMTVIQPLDPRPDRPSVAVPTLDFLGLLERWQNLLDAATPPPPPPEPLPFDA